MKNIAPALDRLIDAAAASVEHAALKAISDKLAWLLDEPGNEAAMAAAAGRKKLSERALDDIALEIKRRALKDIARIFEEELY